MDAPNPFTIEGRGGALPQQPPVPPEAGGECLAEGRDGNADRDKFDAQPAAVTAAPGTERRTYFDRQGIPLVYYSDFHSYPTCLPPIVQLITLQFDNLTSTPRRLICWVEMSPLCIGRFRRIWRSVPGTGRGHLPTQYNIFTL